VQGPLTAFQLGAIAVCIGLNMLDGFDILAMSFSASGVKAAWGLQNSQLGALLSAGLVGMALGSLFLAPCADRWGRRRIVLLSGTIAGIGMSGSTAARGFADLLALRALTGIGIGGTIASVAVVVSEYAPDRWRSAALAAYATGYPVGATIGGVLTNRLRIGMRLQVDPTVIYGLGNTFDGNLKKSHLLEDGPYNTYTRAGLPPTPIAMPGRASLRSAMPVLANPANRGRAVTLTLDQFKILLTQTDFLIFFKNTVIVTVCVVAITMVVSVLAAFSLGRMSFWGSSILATGIFLTYLVPDTLLFLPLFQIVKSVGLLNSYWGMVLVYPTLTVPFCTWIMIGYFQSIPKELDEAALIDGAGYVQMLLKIFIPVALPGIIAAMIFAFTVSWAAFVYPMAFLYSSDQQVLTVGTVTSLIRADVYKWGMLMAGALVAAAPPLVIYAFLMDYYIAGLTAGATKG